MRVSAQYAREHLNELLSAEDADEVEVERQDERTVRLTLVPKAQTAAAERPWGIARGQIWIAEDFDSPAMTQMLADLFEGSSEDGAESSTSR